MTVTEQVEQAVANLLAAHDAGSVDRQTFLGARFDAGLAWIHFPMGCGGLGLPREQQAQVEAALAAAGAPGVDPAANPIGLGMVAPTLATHGSQEQRALLRPLFTAEHVWCQLFSEPGAGSDLAGLATRAVRDRDIWTITGQKVWTSYAHKARWGLLLARTDPDVPKHRGLTCFIVDMHGPGVEVRPLRQLTGQAEFNEVFLTSVQVPDSMRLGALGAGWQVANTTLMNERVSIGGGAAPREAGFVGSVMDLWRSRPEVRTASGHERIVRLWIDAEVARLANERSRQIMAAGQPSADGSGAKIVFADILQRATRLRWELSGIDGLQYDTWQPEPTVAHSLSPQRAPAVNYLRMRAASIAGGTSEVLRGVIADRVLELPREPRQDTTLPWREVPR
jgi:alkylation response protein AidB-like acyl-CoA dehydrogenase